MEGVEVQARMEARRNVARTLLTGHDHPLASCTWSPRLKPGSRRSDAP
jgi:hypothetical protein